MTEQTPRERVEALPARGWPYMRQLDRDWLEADLGPWKAYAERLSPTERKRINGPGAGEGSYRSFRRPVRPTFTVGTWLRAGPSHHIRIGAIQPRPGGYRITIDKVTDDRSPGPRIKATHRTDEGEYEPEPEGVDGAWLKRFSAQSRTHTAERTRRAITE